MRIGNEIQIPIDAGPSGKPLSGGYMDFAGAKGSNIVFTDSMVPEVKMFLLFLQPHLYGMLLDFLLQHLMTVEEREQ